MEIEGPSVFIKRTVCVCEMVPWWGGVLGGVGRRSDRAGPAGWWSGGVARQRAAHWCLRKWQKKSKLKKEVCHCYIIMIELMNWWYHVCLKRSLLSCGLTELVCLCVCFTCATLPVFFRWFWSSFVAPSWKVLGRAASSMLNSGVLSWNNEISTDWAACNTQNTSLSDRKTSVRISTVFFPVTCEFTAGIMFWGGLWVM